jgi:MSHA biogenesis protein MshK
MMRHDLFLLLLAGLVGTASALAQVPDPTRPAGVLMPDAAGAAVAPVESGVQTVILRPGGKSVAVVNGQHVAVGGKLGDKRVVKITESEVVLKGESGREVIKVTPDIEKVPVNKTAAAKRRTTGTTEK